MCDCLEPIRHTCGAFMIFIGIIGRNDVYECARCNLKLFKPCDLVDAFLGEVMENAKA